jgi:phage shock protein A
MVLVPVGAALEARDAVVKTVRTYTDAERAQQQLNRFERRGERALRRNRRVVERQVSEVRESVENGASGLQSETGELFERVRALV